MPGARPVPEGQQGANVSIFGERGAAVSFLVDGADNNDPLNGGALAALHAGLDPRVRGHHHRLRGRVRPRAGRRRQHRHALGHERSRRPRVLVPPRRRARRVERRADQDAPELVARPVGRHARRSDQADKAFFFGSFERLDETRGVNIDRSKIPAFVLSGIATPGGVEDFAIGPETGAYTLVGKVDVTFNDATSPHRHRQRQRRRTSPARSARRSPARRRCRARPPRRAATAAALIGRETDALRQHARSSRSTARLHQQRHGHEPRAHRRGRSRSCCCSAALASCRPARRSAAAREREPNRLQLGQTLSHFKSAWHGDHQFKAGWDFNRVDADRLQRSRPTTSSTRRRSSFPNANDVNAALFQDAGIRAVGGALLHAVGESRTARSISTSRATRRRSSRRTRGRSRRDVTLNAGLRYDYDSLFGGDKNNLAPRLGVVLGRGGTPSHPGQGELGPVLRPQPARRGGDGAREGRRLHAIGLRRGAAAPWRRLHRLADRPRHHLGLPDGDRWPRPGREPGLPHVRQRRCARIRWRSTSCSGSACPNPQSRRSSPPTTSSSCRARRRRRRSRCSSRRIPGTDCEFFDVPGGSIVGNKVLSFFPRGPLALSRDVSVYDEDQTPWTQRLQRRRRAADRPRHRRVGDVRAPPHAATC